MNPYHDRQRGQLTLYVLIFGTIAIVVLSELIIWVDSNLKIAYRTGDQAQAQAIAESGLEYYRWHLAHAPTDFQDGTGQAGPYVHDFADKDGTIVGQYSLDIVPPDEGSSIVTITSTGTVAIAPEISQTVQAKLGMESVIKYAVLSNSNIRFETGTDVYGPVHANGGIQFNGIAHNLVTSARTTYNDPDHSGTDEYAVHTHTSPTDPLPPSPLPVRSDIFLSGRQFPAQLVDFTGLTESLAKIKGMAQTSTGRYFGISGGKGYHIVLKTNDTFTIYKVKKLLKASHECKNSQHQKGWGTWSIDTEQLIGTYAFPTNGVIYAEDHVWIEGQISTARLTVAAGRLPANTKKYRNIIVNKDLTYSYYDGRDALGLIAQGNILVGMDSDTNLRIDSAVVSQNGSVSRFNYRAPTDTKDYCSPYHTRQSITLNGMLATYSGYGFAYTDGTGYQSRTIMFDSHLQYNPPPMFPLISTEYQQIFWTRL